MATKAQIKANRQNSKKSTGPKTDEGKSAVSQNAVKHGLFAESVIYGENEAEYEAFHDNLLSEMNPVGAVELMLAERFVSLSWRLQRAERMQNEVIEDMIGRMVASNPARRRREYYFYNQGKRLEDPGVDLDGLPLGRIATNDWSSNRVLDRMLMYERRIENSLHKTMRELERRRLIRQFQQQEAEQELETEQAIHIPINGNRNVAATRQDEAATRAEKNSDLKKQSQFAPDMIGATPFMKGDYDNMPACGDDENKANLSLRELTQSKPQTDIWQKALNAPGAVSGVRH